MKVVTLKDFKKGDKAYVVIQHTGRSQDSEIVEATVQTVGRKYVSTGEGVLARKYREWDEEFLYENVNCGEASLLFPTRKCAEEYLEKSELVRWVDSFSAGSARRCSLEQLRKVKEILCTRDM